MIPLFSFLMTAYGTERYVGDSIASVLAQTRTDWELIVVDNGNSDELARIVEKYSVDPRVKLLRQENKGVRGGVAAAAHAAVGRYLCPLDSDDQLKSDFCTRVGALIDAHPGVDGVGCDAELFNDPDDGRTRLGYFESVGRKTAPDPSRPVSLADMLEDGVPCYIGTFRRDVWDAHGAFDPATPNLEPDVALWLSMAAVGRNIRVLPDRLARQRMRLDSLSHDPSRVGQFERRLEQTFLAACENAAVDDDALQRSRQIRRLRYNHAMRRARSALLNGDAPGAKAAARDAYGQMRSLRSAAVIISLGVSPWLLRSLHPAKNRVQNAVRRYAFAGGDTR